MAEEDTVATLNGGTQMSSFWCVQWVSREGHQRQTVQEQVGQGSLCPFPFPSLPLSYHHSAVLYLEFLWKTITLQITLLILQEWCLSLLSMCYWLGMVV